MCRIDFLISVWFWFGFFKTLIRFGMSLVWFGSVKKTRFGSDIYILLTTRVTANITATVDYMTLTLLTSLTTTTSK